MDDGSFYIEIEQFKKAFEGMIENTEIMAEALQELDLERKKLSTAWEGEGFDAMMEKLNKVMDNLAMENNRLGNCTISLGNVVEDIVKTDKKIANILRGN